MTEITPATPAAVPAPARISQPGVYPDISHDDYHDDCCEIPSLSASVGHLLNTRSPRHAWIAHPRLNPAHERKSKDNFDFGDLVHQVMLRDKQRIVLVDAADWRTDKAKELRAKARAAGMVPCLKKNWPEIEAMVAAGRAQLTKLELDPEDPPQALVSGRCEQTMIWTEDTEFGPIWCRCRVDWLYNDLPYMDDVKTTEVAATADGWGKGVCFDMGNDFRAAFYERGYQKLFGVKNPTYRFLVFEADVPYAMRAIKLEQNTMDAARQKVERTIKKWAWCMSKKWWPGYPRHTLVLSAPPWHLQKWEDQKLREQYHYDNFDELMRLGMAFQAPLEQIEGPKADG